MEQIPFLCVKKVHFHSDGDNTMDKENFRIYKENLKEKYLAEGFSSLSEAEKLGLLLSYCGCDEDCCHRLLEEFGSVDLICNADIDYLRNYDGLSSKSAILLKLIPGIAKKCLSQQTTVKRLDSPEKAVAFFESFFLSIAAENFAVVCVDRKMNIISARMLETGNENSVKADSKSVLNIAVKNKANYVFLAHNHLKSGASPSFEDITTTNSISKALEMFDIFVVDHIIVSPNGSASLREMNCNLDFKKTSHQFYKIHNN